MWRTFASIVKYPYASTHASAKKKFGFFQTEEETYCRIARELGIPGQAGASDAYVRYPLVYLVEAADDICYQIMDIEDAHKLRLLTSEEAIGLLLGFFEGRRLNDILFWRKGIMRKHPCSVSRSASTPFSTNDSVLRQ